MNITSAQYTQSEFESSPSNIKATIDGVEMSVPLDPANRHYAAILQAVANNELNIAPAE